MTDLLGPSTPLNTYRRDLAAVRAAIKSIGVGDDVTARFRAPGHGVFEVTGKVWISVADDMKVGWWDLTSGSSGKPADELQALSAATPVAALPAYDRGDLREQILSLSAGDLVTAAFDFDGSGPFTLRGSVRVNDRGTTWVIASIYIGGTTGEPSGMLRALTIDQQASTNTAAVETTSSAAAAGTYNLFGD
jgi:hypothetical protein